MPTYMPDGDFAAFYAAFSERFRGPFAVIKERLKVYVPLLAADGQLRGPIVDLGVGRGEWLELLKEAGMEAWGVDVNPHVIAQTRARGLRVEHADAIESLGRQADGTLGAVTAFHIIEHLAPPTQLRLFRESFRSLVPGGVLLLEWPNAEHPQVSRYNFWFDPTHLVLLPHELVSFMAEYVGFQDVRIQRLDSGRIVAKEGMDISLVGRKPLV